MVGAASSGEATNIGSWIIAGTAVIQFLVLILQIQRSGRAEKREVTMMPGAVEKPVFEAHVRDNKSEHENLFAKIGGVERGIQSKFEAKLDQLRNERTHDMDKLHAEITDLMTQMGGLDTATQMQNQSLAAISTKLDRVAERMISDRRH